VVDADFARRSGRLVTIALKGIQPTESGKFDPGSMPGLLLVMGAVTPGILLIAASQVEN